MARTSKSRGAIPFQMRSGNSSPYKFLGKALKAATGGVGTLVGNALGGKGGNNEGPSTAGIVGGIVGGPAGFLAGSMLGKKKGVGGPVDPSNQAMAVNPGAGASALQKKSPYKEIKACNILGTPPHNFKLNSGCLLMPL